MSTSSKSPRKVALAVLAVGKDALPDDSHRCSPKIYTQPQLFALLVMKRFLKTDFRGLIEKMKDMPEVCRAIDLTELPHFTAVHKAEGRLLKLPKVRALLASSVHLALGDTTNIKRAAVDSTGMQSGSASSYYVRRRSREVNLWQTTTYRRYPKLGLVCDTQSHLILGFKTGLGPRPDVDELAGLLDSLVPGIRVQHVLADAGYDSEGNHIYARDYHGILTTIPARIGRPTSKPPSGKHRRLMKQTLASRKYYGQRWQVETVNSMIKRNQGQTVAARRCQAQQRELRLAALTHNIAILLLMWVFYRAGQCPTFWSAAVSGPAQSKVRHHLGLFGGQGKYDGNRT